MCITRVILAQVLTFTCATDVAKTHGRCDLKISFVTTVSLNDLSNFGREFQKGSSKSSSCNSTPILRRIFRYVSLFRIFFLPWDRARLRYTRSTEYLGKMQIFVSQRNRIFHQIYKGVLNLLCERNQERQFAWRHCISSNGVLVEISFPSQNASGRSIARRTPHLVSIAHSLCSSRLAALSFL